jgi:hypothetical protein
MHVSAVVSNREVNMTTVDPSPHWARFESNAEIPKDRTPWFVLLLMILAIVAAVLMVVGFWMAAGPHGG